MRFGPDSVYGIITDGESWKSLLWKHSKLTIDKKGYHIGSVADIIDRIGYIAKKFRKPE